LNKIPYRVLDGNVKTNVGIPPESWLFWSWLVLFYLYQ